MIINTTLNYSDENVQNRIFNIMDEVRSSPFISKNEDLVENWLKMYINSEFYKENQFMDGLWSAINYAEKSTLPMNIKFNKSDQNQIIGMISHKNSLIITIFGHNHKILNFM